VTAPHIRHIASHFFLSSCGVDTTFRFTSHQYHAAAVNKMMKCTVE
jgi:hypothetical protein